MPRKKVEQNINEEEVKKNTKQELQSAISELDASRIKKQEI